MTSRPITIRFRIAATMVALVAVVLAATGVAVVLTESRMWRAQVDATLVRVADEFRVLAENGVDPETGQPFAGPSQLIETYLSRTVLSEAEGEMGIVDGRVAWVGGDTSPVRPEEDSGLVRHLLPLTRSGEVTMGTYAGTQREYRYIVVPVQFSDSQPGALVHVYLLDVISARIWSLMTVLAVVYLVAVSGVVAIAWRLVGQLLRPVEQLRATAENITENADLSRRVPVEGRDDLARLSTAINTMLDSLETMDADQRQLLDDVGHELRTPITIVRGHLELMDAADPSDAADTRALALEELDRMNSLVGDLLTLAKSERADFVVPREVDIAALTERIFDKATGLGSRAWNLGEVARGQVWLDPERITQAVLQLAANAVKYSEDGSPVEISSTVAGGRVSFTVEDAGCGIAPEDTARIMERFARGRNTGRSEGSGLGLAIVSSIARAHGGEVTVRSRLGEGSVFTLSLPSVYRGT
ncbi:sensor histidine kinase [Actinotignum sanguinis]|uniref:sensor histidine kinase n=1 Tax=Actinotignum TaxID=1653174 RepID=UPI000F7E4679|nr:MULTISPECIES: sensor histidine kinase [Actinotignum]MDY5126978.1 ATP-binding protein [Actinotignum sp. SLA_B059]MDY5148644.1 ATP-binding protein [Actinotignum sanguinis]RTE51015.1 sensor histidine kinase [Actinotignum sanguinis]